MERNRGGFDRKSRNESLVDGAHFDLSSLLRSGTKRQKSTQAVAFDEIIKHEERGRGARERESERSKYGGIPTAAGIKHHYK